MTGLLELVRRHQLSSFFLLAFTLTWLAFIPWYASQGEGIPWFTFGPFVAALAIAATIGGWTAIKGILASIVHWRVGVIWYVVALGLPLAIQLIAIFLNSAFGSAAPAWGNVPPLSHILPMVALFAIFSGPLGEEPGWRGFAMPRLLARYSALTASLVLGFVWAAWHLPLAFVDDLTVSGSINVVVAASVFTWLYQNTRGSVLLAILMHMSHQNSVRYLSKVFNGPDQIQQQWVAVAIWAIVALAIVLIAGRSRFSPKGFGPEVTTSRT